MPLARPIQVHAVLMDGHVLLDLVGPLEALRVANRLLASRGQPPAFDLRFVGPGRECRSAMGLALSDLAPLPSPPQLTAAPGPHWVLMPGQVGERVERDTPPARELQRWLAQLPLAQGQVELVCVCAGSVIAGHAGLLAHRRATTHHLHLDELKAAEPLCEVLPHRLFVHDGPVWTSAGVTTGIDLMLHRIGEVGGPALAAEVAQHLVLALRRGPDDPELSPFLHHRDHRHAALHRVQDAIQRDPRHDWDLPAMAALACTSPRHLTRLFEAHAGVSPLRYLRQVRLALAEAALASGHSVTQAAELAGFRSDGQLRRAWQQMGPGDTPRARRPGSARQH